jgi:hypothetical protein
MFGYRTITIAAPLCAPARSYVSGINNKLLAPYDFKHPIVWDGGTVKNDERGVYNKIHIAVHDQAAEWAEYLLCRAGFGLESTPVNPKNLEYAERWQTGTARQNGWYDSNHVGEKLPSGGVIGHIDLNPMPTPWKDQPRQPGRSKRRKSAPEPTRKSGIGKALKEFFS